MEDIHALKVFAAVAQNLSFTRAAEGLFLTQSAVSHQIARLERELGVSLILREGRNISLTPSGSVLLERAERIFLALEDAKAAVHQAAKPRGGRLRVGASATACQFLIPEALREFRECYPDYTLHIAPGDNPQVSQDLSEGRIDLGVMIRLDRGPKLHHHPLFTDELGFLISRLHPWAATGKVDHRQIGQQRLILYTRNSATFRLVERYYIRMRTELRDWIELGSMEAIKELVKLGLGVSIVGRWIAQPELEARSLVWLPLPGGSVKRNWTIAATAGRKLTVAEQTFIGLCQSAGAEIERCIPVSAKLTTPRARGR
jgi:LysR family transcriptional regulator, low CO2-responsive transcriptional regulator